MKYTPKQIEKYKRQKYINFLEKIARNLFKMFRNRDITEEKFLKKFVELKVGLDRQSEVQLNSEYHELMKSYIEQLYRECQRGFKLDDIRDLNMTQLNRLQKLKNRNSYKKDKHKYKSRDEEWD